MADKKETVEVELTPQQINMQAHIQSLTSKINKHQFEIDELMPSLNTYQKAFTESLKQKSNTINEESKNDDN
tara:strand:+ start:22 stop:237 length:216 start_codon:yes stop_codon:yes gene_type:complete